jgi:hypothetical protein
MGRLTLNVLLSFAQFEREVTGERIRDKIAASKKKGIWVGGVVPLGYRVEDGKLVIDPSEAETVRSIFERYLVVESLPELQRELRESGTLTRRRELATGKVIGGVALTNGALAYLLRNRVYLGELNHRGKSYPGAHQAIIDGAVFEAVQTKLTANRNGFRQRRSSSDALLLGRVFDDRGNRMTPSYAIKKGVRYRYYISCVLAQGRKEAAGSVARVTAPEIEAVVLKTLQPLIGLDRNSGTAPNRRAIDELVEKVVITRSAITIALFDHAPMIVPWSPPIFRRKRELIELRGNQGGIRPIRADARRKLVSAIAKSRHWLAELIAGRAPDTHALAVQEGLSERSVRNLLSLAFLAPDIINAAFEGRLPRGFGMSRLVNLPIEWEEQIRHLGL